MATSIRVYKPMTAGTRQRSVLTGSEITKKTPEKSLTVPVKKLLVEIIKVKLLLDIEVAE